MVNSDSPTPVRWQAAAPETMVWRSWDGGFVMFHRPSGVTHLLNAASAELIREVLAVPRSIDEAASHLFGQASLDEIGALEPMLEHFEELGLIGRLR